jgi:lipopolysaccharide transport system permease protein
MFACPVVYPLASVPSRFRVVYDLDPMAGVIENFRRVLLEGKAPDGDSLWMAAAITLALVAPAYLFFKNREATMADVI